MPRSLAIIVPYRDRESHIRELMPELASYLGRRHPGLAYRIWVIEQARGKHFNVGTIRNVGFALARAEEAHEQVCFHDVDYVPIDVDYGPVDGPTRLIWHGLRHVESREHFFSAVVAFPSVDFERVNGYPNAYWSWGSEDREIRLRCRVAGLAIRHRDGTFRPLPHPHEGYGGGGDRDARAIQMRALLKARMPGLRAGTVQREDGLTSLRFREIRRRRVAIGSVPQAPFLWHVVVEI
ncbi:MAG: hypothetical protein IT561_01105 [Alphaproteobacteria bacterium]|nr:hypothetical protein [Alphaproteobacteria bacterium]